MMHFCHCDVFTVCTVHNVLFRLLLNNGFQNRNICFVPCSSGNEGVYQSESLCFGLKATYSLNPMLMHAASHSLPHSPQKQSIMKTEGVQK